MADWEVELFEEQILNAEFASVGCILSSYERIFRLLKMVIYLELGDKLSSETIYQIRHNHVVLSMATDIFASYQQRMVQQHVHDVNEIDRFFTFVKKSVKHIVRYRNLMAHLEVYNEGRYHEILPFSTSFEPVEPSASEEATARFDVRGALEMYFVEETGSGKLRLYKLPKSDIIEMATYFRIVAQNIGLLVEEMRGDIDEGSSPFDAFCATYKACFVEEWLSELEVIERIEKKLERKMAYIKDLDYHSAYPW